MTDQWEDEARRLHDMDENGKFCLCDHQGCHVDHESRIAAALRAAYDKGAIAAIDDCERVLSATPVREWAMPYKSQAMARLGILRKGDKHG